MNYNATGSRGDITPVTITSGAAVPIISDPTNTGSLLGANTYYFPLGGIMSGVPLETVEVSVHMRWAALVAGTATFECSNFPATLGGSGQGGSDVTDYDSTVSNWVQIDPTLAGSIYCNAVGTNNSVAKYTVTLGGTNLGAAIWNIPAYGFRRGRIKLVTTVGGIVRASVWGKLGS